MIISNPAIQRAINYVKTNKYTFRLWYRLYLIKYRGKIKTWFSEKTAFYIDGYPRSGNTFMQMLIKNVFADTETVHHFHSIGSLRLALDRGLPSFILYRNPADSITSNYLKVYAMNSDIDSFTEITYNHRLLRSLATYYAHYYTHVLTFMHKIHLIPFDELISNPEHPLIFINKSLPSPQRVNENHIINTVNQVKDRPFGAKDKLGSSRPNQEKERAKRRLKTMLYELSEYDEAMAIYEELNSALNLRRASPSGTRFRLVQPIAMA